MNPCPTKLTTQMANKVAQALSPAGRAQLGALLPRSEVELPCHLDRPITSRTGDLAEAGAAEAGVRKSPLRRIRHAIGLQPQLHVLPLRDVEVLHQCRI